MRQKIAASSHVLLVLVASVAASQNVNAQQPSPGGSSTLLSAPVGAGARAMGMGGAFIAIADDATAASWNPAGLGLIDRPQVSFAGDLSRIASSMPSWELTKNYTSGLRIVESGPGVSATRKSQDPNFASVTYPFKLGIWRIVPQFSYRRAIKTNFAETLTQPYQYVESTGYRETGSDTLTFDGDGGVDVYSGAAGVAFHHLLTIGVAVNVWRGRSGGADTRTVNGSYSLGAASASLKPSTYETTYREKFDGTNVDAGVLITPLHWLRLGVVLKNKFNVTRAYDYGRQYTNWLGGVSAETYNETGTIEWPRSLGVGVAVIPFDALTVSTDYTRSSWSNATYRFASSDVQTINGRSTTIQASGVVIYPEMYDPARPVQQYFNIPQRDSSQFRAGGEFVWLRSRSGGFAGIPLRAGAYRNRSFLPQSNGNERIGTGVTAGAGVEWRQLRLDAAYVREAVSGKNAEFPMTPFGGFSESQQEDGLHRAVLHQVLFLVTARF